MIPKVLGIAAGNLQMNKAMINDAKNTANAKYF